MFRKKSKFNSIFFDALYYPLLPQFDWLFPIFLNSIVLIFHLRSLSIRSKSEKQSEDTLFRLLYTCLSVGLSYLNFCSNRLTESGKFNVTSTVILNLFCLESRLSLNNFVDHSVCHAHTLRITDFEIRENVIFAKNEQHYQPLGHFRLCFHKKIINFVHEVLFRISISFLLIYIKLSFFLT